MSLQRRTPLRSRTRLRSRGRKAKREQPDIDAFRAAVKARAGGMCEVRTGSCPPGPHVGHSAHHRWPSDRDRGVHDPDRGLWVCAPGHLAIHGSPSVSQLEGWLLRDGMKDPWLADDAPECPMCGCYRREDCKEACG